MMDQALIRSRGMIIKLKRNYFKYFRFVKLSKTSFAPSNAHHRFRPGCILLKYSRWFIVSQVRQFTLFWLLYKDLFQINAVLFFQSQPNVFCSFFSALDVLYNDIRLIHADSALFMVIIGFQFSGVVYFQCYL